MSKSPEISRELEKYHRRCPCVTLNICMFHGWLASPQGLLLVKLCCGCGFFFSLGKAVGGFCVSVQIVFFSKVIICNLPSPTNPREPILLKTYIAWSSAAYLSPGKWCQQHIQWLRRWAPGKSQSKCFRVQTPATSARQLHLPHSCQGSDQPVISNWKSPSVIRMLILSIDHNGTNVSVESSHSVGWDILR